MDSLKNLAFRNKSKQKKRGGGELQGSSSANTFIQLFIMYQYLFDAKSVFFFWIYLIY